MPTTSTGVHSEISIILKFVPKIEILGQPITHVLRRLFKFHLFLTVFSPLSSLFLTCGTTRSEQGTRRVLDQDLAPSSCAAGTCHRTSSGLSFLPCNMEHWSLWVPLRSHILPLPRPPQDSSFSSPWPTRPSSSLCNHPLSNPPLSSLFLVLLGSWGP